MKEHLAVVDHSNVYRIAWILEDGEEGLTLGPDEIGQTSDAESRGASIALKDIGAESDAEGFYWDTVGGAKKALAVARAAAKAALDKLPYPEWAIAALANGWKEPKGWRPLPK